MQDWIQGGDISVLDRGYRDAVAYLQRLRIQIIIPALLQQGQIQFTNMAVKQASLVTCTRFNVEMRIGHLFSYVLRT